jgi:hypothetical protein
MEKKVNWSDLSFVEQITWGETRGCGPGRWAFFIPQFIFKASCLQHDLYYSRGGDIVDKFEADVMFLAYMLKDINAKYDKWYKKLFYVAMAKLYFIAVTIYGPFCFTWGRYRTKVELLHPKPKLSSKVIQWIKSKCPFCK